MSKKKHPLDKKIVCSYSITRRTSILFEERCKELGLGRSATLEELIKTFLQ